MSFLKSRHLFAFLLMISLCFTSCFSGTKKESSTQKKFDSYTKQLFQDTVSSDTITLHYTLKHPKKFGIVTSKISLGDFHPSSMEKQKVSIEEDLSSLKRFSYDKLTTSQQHTYDTLKDYLQVQHELSSFSYIMSLLSPTLGVQCQLPISLCEYALDSKKDLDVYFTLLNQIPSYFDSIIAYEKEHRKNGYFISDRMITSVVTQIRKFIQKKQDNMLIQTFSSRISHIASISQETKISYEAKNQEIVISKVLPAFKNLADTLERYKGFGHDQGLVHQEHGRTYYEALVHYYTGSKKDVPALILQTSKHLDQLKDSMIQTTKKDPKGSLRFLKLNFKTYISKHSNQILDDLRTAISKSYPKPPTVHFTIKNVHPSLEDSASPAFYMVPALDNYKNNTIYLNQKEQKDSIQRYATLAHEGYPGHLYQTTYFFHKNMDLIRYTLDFPGYTEGWATYAELQSYSFLDFGDHDHTIDELLKTNSLFSLALSSRVDMGVNYEGWNLSQVKVFLGNYNIQDTKIATNIYHAVLDNPGNYLSYYIGCYELQQLKEYYKGQMGKLYQEKTFHKIILDAGPTSFPLLKKRINEYMLK